jgi:hypothetical protein
MIQPHRSMEVYMRPFLRLLLVAVCSLFAAPGVAAAAQQGVPLASVARTANLQYAWLGAERAVQLSGPGLVVVVRPGDPIYGVNDHVEVAAVTPHYAANDIYVSPATARRIEALAGQAWTAFSRTQETLARQEAAMANTAMGAAEMQGSIVLHVQPLKGAEALLVTGEAPPEAPVRITLLATMSSDLPNVLLSRNDLTSSSAGTFQAIVPIAPDYLRRSFIHVLATSVPGVTSASAQIMIDAPNAGVMVPVESFPGGIW